ncbi:MAG: sugar ABC transporter substrate-binding protein, partial [Anaerolineales bacterium]|nr:sugar ABC transporter substrate-binding protein [Anaerolineales bacterium]
MKRVLFSFLVLVTLLLSACTAVAPAAPAAEPAAGDAAGGEGAAVSAGGQEYTVGLAWNRKDQSLIQAWEDYMVASGKAVEAADGIKLNWVINVADGDPARLASNIEDLINQGVDLIVTRPEDAAAIGASIKAANEAGIPVVTFDRASSTEQPAAHVGADSYNQAISTGEEFAKILDAAGVKGKCIELQGALTDINAVNRSKGWNDVDAKSESYETIVQVPTEWNPDLFRSGTANALQANPDANCLFVASDFAFSAVQSALEAAGRWAPAGEEGHVWIAAQDVNPQGLAPMEGGYIDVATTYDAFSHSQELVRVVAAILKGEDPGCSA